MANPRFLPSFLSLHRNKAQYKSKIVKLRKHLNTTCGVILKVYRETCSWKLRGELGACLLSLTM